jgi:hypothetical protein
VRVHLYLPRTVQLISLNAVFRVALYEALVNIVLPLCTRLPHSTETPVSQVTTIVDLDGVSIGTMWSLRKHLQVSSVLATANYPETLSATIAINAPPFFPTVWGWIKVRYHPFTSSNV